MAAARPPRRWLDRVLGIVIGIVLGVGIIVAFVFLGSEETIDAPRLDNTPAPAAEAPVEPGPGQAPGDTGGEGARP